MRIENLRFALLVSAFSVAALVPEAAMAQAAKKTSARDAAIAKCVAEAQAAAPGILTPGEADRARRVAVYKNCMVQARQRP
jgi:hypothetical protein